MLMPDQESRQVPRILTPLPGPRARAVIEDDRRYVSPSYTRDYPLVAERGWGAVLEDVDGNRFLDFTSGIAVCATGHCHPRIVQAIEQQSRQLIHMSGTDFYYRPQRDLARRLAELAPGGSPKRVFFTNSGAESVEAAIKLSRYHSGRQEIVAFLGGFHGRTCGALSLTASKSRQRAGFGPLLPGVHHVEYPHEYRGGAAATERTFQQLEQLVRHKVPADEIAAVVVEPIQGEGGYLVPPDAFLPALRDWTRERGILLVADEVQTGMGRTGRMFACQHWGVEPDILCLAKGIASGLPLGAVVAPADVMDWPPGSHASTFGGNPVACAAALATIDLLEEELIANAVDTGSYLLAELRRIAESRPAIGDVRGRGLMAAMELVSDREQRQPNPALRNRVIQVCFQKGLLLLGCGTSCLRFCPPLVVSRSDVDTATRILLEAFDEMDGAPDELIR